MPILKEWDFTLDADKVLWGQGMNPSAVRARRPKLVELAERAIEEDRGMLDPQVVYSRHPVIEMRHEQLRLAQGRLQGPLIASHLAGAEEIVAAVCTVGDRLSKTASEMFEQDPAFALALNGLASAATEALGEEACRRFEVMAEREGMKSSIPLNPGMVGWPIEDSQPQVFALLDAGEIGVTLNPSGLMSPLKSLSLVMGFGKELNASGKSCDFCAMRETCQYQDHYRQQEGAGI